MSINIHAVIAVIGVISNDIYTINLTYRRVIIRARRITPLQGDGIRNTSDPYIFYPSIITHTD